MTLADDRLNIDTPENVAVGFSVAGIGSRFLAALVDTVIIVVLQVLAILPVLLLTDASSAWIFALLSLIAFCFFWGYYVFFEMVWNGQSPGKRLVGLRVVRAEGTPEGLSESLIRNLIRLIDFLPIAYGVGVIAMFIDGRSRRLGDMAGGTMVIHDRPPVGIDTLKSVIGPPADKELSRAVIRGFPVGRLTEADLQLIDSYLGRRNVVANPAELARQILEGLCVRLSYPFDDYLTANAEPVLYHMALLAGRHAR
jgi:uncharacterized RDD family membrane protein YckC